MKLKPRIFFVLILYFSLPTLQIHAQTIEDENIGENITFTDGWKIGALPNISYDTDVGFRYGILANYNYRRSGNCCSQPDHSLNFEWSRTNRGNGINRLYYNSPSLIPSLNLNWEISYLTDHELQFFGYNGYDAVYNSAWENSKSDDYKSELFYRHDRNVFKINADFNGLLFRKVKELKWFAGLTYLDIDVGSIDLNSISKYRSVDEDLADIEVLYDKYVKWGIIEGWESKGDNITFLKGGLIYDSRNQEYFPSKGVFSEMIVSYAPSLPGDGKLDFARVSFFWRHYLSIDSEDLVFAYRFGFQGAIFGKVPFFIQPYIVSSDIRPSIFQGLGGAKTLRGVMRNRVVGNGIFLGNTEIRWKFINTTLFRREMYLGINLFADFGQVVDKIEFDINQSEVDPEDNLEDYFSEGSEKLHLSGGTGLKIGYNKYFVLSMDYGLAMDNRDGNSGFYINLNWLF